MTNPVGNRRPAVTLIETIVVMSVIGILIGLLSVSIQRVREDASLVNCQSQLKDLVLAVHSYHNFKGKMPPYASGRPKEMHGGWYMHLLPYVEREDLYAYIRANQITVNKKSGIRIATTGSSLPEVQNAVFPNLVCASDPTRRGADNKTNYLANWFALSDGVRGTYRRAQSFSSLTNGLSNTVLFAEGYSECKGLPRLALYSSHYHNFGITQEGLPSDDPWYAPKNYMMFQMRLKECDHWRTQTAHITMPTAFADGSVRNIAPSISLTTWTHLMKARDGSAAGGDW